MQNILAIDGYNTLLSLMHLKSRDVLWDYLTEIKSYMEGRQIHKAVIFKDAGESAYRLSMYPEYKSDRKVMREKMKEKDPAEAARREAFMKEAREVLDILPSFGIEVFSLPRIEADDCIAYLVQHTDLTKFRIATLSSDTDLFQLIRPNVVQRGLLAKMKYKPLDLEVGAGNWVTRDSFINAYGTSPEKWHIVKSLAGDTSDSITSPKGLGEGFALAMVKKYDTLEEILQRAADGTLDIPRLQAKTKEALGSPEGRAMVERNVLLTRLNYTPEQEAEIFSGAAKEKIDDLISRLSAPPDVDMSVVEDCMIKSGKVGFFNQIRLWEKTLKGKNNT